MQDSCNIISIQPTVINDLTKFTDNNKLEGGDGKEEGGVQWKKNRNLCM